MNYLRGLVLFSVYVCMNKDTGKRIFGLIYMCVLVYRYEFVKKNKNPHVYTRAYVLNA